MVSTPDLVGSSRSYSVLRRLLEYGNSYFDLKSLPNGETKRALTRFANKKAGKAPERSDHGARRNAKRKKLKR
jgi:hypothetical protein